MRSVSGRLMTLRIMKSGPLPGALPPPCGLDEPLGCRRAELPALPPGERRGSLGMRASAAPSTTTGGTPSAPGGSSASCRARRAHGLE